jgi:hypothetical protein
LVGIGADISREVEFAASHFHELDESSMSDVSFEMLCKIMQSKLLKIKSEDWLCGLICDMVSRDRNSFSLFEYVRFEFLSSEVARRFIDLACELIDSLNSSILAGVGCRFILPVSPETRNSRITGRREFGLKPDSPLDGIIAYLTSNCGGNVHERGIVNVTASSYRGGSLKEVADLQNRSGVYQTAYHDSNPWICYDFKHLRVTPTHYALRSYSGCGRNICHPKSWYIEGSNDGTEWTVLHECANNSDLNGASLIGQYAVSKSMKCRFVRIRQTQHHGTCANAHYLTLSGFELHGILHEP